MFFIRIIFFILFCFSAFSQSKKCHTFRSVDYQFGFSEEKQEDQKSFIVTLQQISKNQKPKRPVTTTSDLKIIDAGGFLNAYIMAMGFVQYIHRNPNSSKKARSNMIGAITMYLTNFRQKMQSLHKDLSQNLKPKDLQNINSIIRETTTVLKLLTRSKQDIQLLSDHFDKMRNFIHLARVSHLDDVKSKIKTLMPLKVLINKGRKWENQDVLTEVHILPPLSISGQRMGPFLCNREAVSIRASVTLPRSFLK